jgi:hypothetical protein
MPYGIAYSKVDVLYRKANKEGRTLKLHFTATGSILYRLTKEYSVVLPAEHALALICQIQLQQVCLLPIKTL